MPLAAPPGPLWTADAKEPHPSEIAPSTEPVSPIRTSSLAWMLPFTLPRTTTGFADNCA